RSLVRVDPVLVSPGSAAEPAALQQPPKDPGQVQLTFLTGPRRGQSLPLGDLQVETPASGAMRPVSPAELERIGIILAGRPGAPPPPPSPPPTLPPTTLPPPEPLVGGGETAAALPSGALYAANATSTDLDRPTIQAPTASDALRGKMEILY